MFDVSEKYESQDLKLMCAGSSQSDVQLSMIGGHCGRRVASFYGDDDQDEDDENE